MEKAPSTDKWSRCGRGCHGRQYCPVKDPICHSCKKTRTFQLTVLLQSQSKTVADITIGDEFSDVSYLNTINADQDNAWIISVRVNSKEVPFKLDTGAEVSVVPEGTLNNLKLRKTSKQLCGLDRRQLDVLGEISVTLYFKHQPASRPYTLWDSWNRVFWVYQHYGTCQ